MKTHIFFSITIIPKFQRQIYYTLKGTEENVQVICIPILISYVFP